MGAPLFGCAFQPKGGKPQQCASRFPKAAPGTILSSPARFLKYMERSESGFYLRLRFSAEGREITTV